MGRSPCCEKVGLKKGPWTPEEDQKLLAYIEEHGHGSWRALPAKAGLQRCGKSCRLRWTNYLRPDIKRGKFSIQEEQTIIQLHALLGNRWSAIATHLPKRTDNEIKNYWNTHLKKRLTKMGIDPVTHKPKNETLASSSVDGPSKSIANLSHMAQWESARLEAEARLARESKLRANPSSSLKLPHNKSPPLPCIDEITPWQEQGQGIQGKIDLESPSSTLCYSERIPPAVPSIGLVDHHRRRRRHHHHHHHSSTTELCHQGNNDTVLERDEVEWKCFGEPIRLFDSKNQQRVDGLPIPAFSVDHTSTVFGSESPWLQEPSSTRTGPSGRDLFFGYTDMLLDNSDEHNSSGIRLPANSDNAECGSCIEEEEKEEEEEEDEAKGNNYWSNIFDLVNSPPPSA